MESTIPKIMPLKWVSHVGKCMVNPESYRQYANTWRTATNTETGRYAMEKLDAARAADVAAHEANLAAIENNQLVRARVSELMQAVGIPDKWTHKDEKSRARFPKTITERAGYLDDLDRNAPIDDGFDKATDSYRRLKADYERWIAKAEKDDREAQAKKDRDEAAKRERRKADIELATMIVRYGLDPDIEWDGVLDFLRSKDQRIDLAVAMEQTRGDWSEGFWRVEDALGRFTIETGEDKDIAADVLGCCRGGDDDGRVFRDTVWSYDAIFASVADQQLANDARLAASHASRW